MTDRHRLIRFIHRTIPLHDRIGLELQRMPAGELWALITRRGLAERFRESEDELHTNH